MIVEILLLLSALTAFWYWKFQRYSDRWDKLGVKSPKGNSFPLGDNPLICKDVLLRRANISEVAIRQYREMDGVPYYGVNTVGKPALFINDPELLKQILVKDFHHFADRNGKDILELFGTGTFTDEIWLRQMSSLTGDDWKDLRSTFSPIFTSGKLKGMLRFVRDVNRHLVASFEQEVGSSEFELKEKFGRFSMDSIASCAFGVDAQSFTNGNSQFVKNARAIFRRTIMDLTKFLLAFVPGAIYVFRALKIPMQKPRETKFFYDVLTSVLEERRRNQTRRNDLVDLMLDAMKDESIASEVKEEEEDQFEKDAKLAHKAKHKEFDVVSVVATALVLLVAGYDTTGQTLSYAAFELARNPKIQEKLQEEIDELYENNNGEEPDYYQIQSMEYLDQVLNETLRLHPALGVLQRTCTKDYHLPGTNLDFKVGDDICVNVAGIHSDPKYYPNPEVFDPDRFSKDERARRSPYTFLAFGQGPRNCIGMRFAMLEAKAGLVAVLRQFKMLPCAKTAVGEIPLDPVAFLGAPKGGLYVKIERRNI